MKTINFPAHIKYEKKYENWIKIVQTVEEHCRETAKYAGEALADVGLYNTAYLSGLLHDLGKYTQEYCEYIENVTDQNIKDEDKKKRGSVNHTFAGVKYILDNFHSEKTQRNEKLTSEVIAYAIGAHHGLFDCIDGCGKNGFLYRQNKENINYDEAVKNFQKFIAEEEIKQLFVDSVKEIQSLIAILDRFCKNEDEKYFAFGMLCRLVLSAVIEGDRRSTAEFMNGISFANSFRNISKDDWNIIYDKVTEKVLEFNIDFPIDKARRQLSDMCANAADKSIGVYRLNIPTGGGKTLSSLRYALKHASGFDKKRIIFVMPLLSIIEQNAREIRKYVQDDKIILEHHSNVIDEKHNTDELDDKELLVETWDAPIIITTLVQMLYTFFLGKTTSIRRIKSLTNSVIVFDEIQTVPNKMLWMFNLAVNFLSNVCGATVILCSATQPCLENVDHPMVDVSNLIDIDKQMLNVFKRVELIDKKNMSMDDLCVFVSEKATECKSVLVVCNTKAEANTIYNKINLRENIKKVYLSSNMCVKHREAVVNEIKESLKNASDTKLVCISTQVIEAGVDVSFACVIRLRAGMDSIVQAAGRCNRHGEMDGVAQVYIVNLLNESLDKLPEIHKAKKATDDLLEEHDKDNVKYKDLMGDDSIALYYKKLYGKMNLGYQGFCKTYKGGKIVLFDILSGNNDFYNENKSVEWEKTILHQGFKTAGQQFEVFEDNTVDVIVPYGFGKDVITNLCDSERKNDIVFLKEWIEKSKGYTVSVYNYQLKKLQENAGVTQVEKLDMYVLNDNYYKDDVGLVLENNLIV